MNLVPEQRHQLVGPGKLWKMKRKFQVDFALQRGLLPGNTFLDIGCGTLRGGIPIIQYLDTGNYFGVEIRKKVLEEGRQELYETGCEHKEPTLVGGIELKKVELRCAI